MLVILENHLLPVLILRPVQMKHLHASLWSVDLNQGHTLQGWTQYRHSTYGNGTVMIITRVCIGMIGVFMPASRQINCVPFLV